MALGATLNIRIGADIRGLTSSLKQAEKRLSDTTKQFRAYGRELTNSLTLPLAGVATGALASFANFQKLEKALLAVSGGADEAQSELEKLRAVAKLPGINFEEAVRGSVRLQSVGLSADEARKSLTVFGTAIAATGGGAEQLERVVYQLNQMISKNRILQEDFGIIQENVSSAGKALEIAFGTRNIEAIRDTGISAQEFNRRLVDALAQLPELQTDLSSLSNSFENFKNALGDSLVELGRAINETFDLQGIFDKLGDAIRAASVNFKNLDDNTKRTIVTIAAIVAAIGPVIVAFTTLRIGVIALGVNFTKAFGLIKASVSGIASLVPLLVTPWGVAIAAIVGGLVYAYNNVETFRNGLKGLVNVINQVAIESSKVFSGIGAAIKLAVTGNVSLAAEVLKTTFSEEAGSGIGAAWARGFEDGISDVTLDPLKNKINEVKNSISNFFTAPTTGLDVGGGALDPINTAGGGTGGQQSNALITVPPIEPLQLFRTELESLNEVQLKTIEISTEVSKSYSGIANIIDAASSSIVSAANAGETSFKKLGQAALRGAADVARAALIKVVAKSLEKLFESLGPLAIPLAGGVAALAGGVFNSILKGLKIPALASGGLAFSPTLAVVGDNRNAGADPEVIAPLSKLKQYLGGNNQVVGTFRVSGKDLELVLERSQADSQRVSPF